ncbi:MAG: LysR family transcriptional regulator [Aurantimonas endophytica]|uniref:DNA-binding transcriptional LysR family regulator n=1 Tax=Aurantimonas endophytica TaxID=1522175 RepID=A0A7W6HGM4_9HYPH|nr:LysR family transcriptional regulator [Aurantimonas endophytica]MBB4004854.1 DNA-binding transcriptional LysR family regulator [Aurantimonas endophytica]MCO6405664.1 LysR family transcriptional regulator [Aurantimonas endophytica]
MNELEDLRSLVEVIETGGLNRAATRLGVSKSIVSRRIARLEADLGTRLLIRTSRGVSPTEAGLQFKERCERILGELDEARDAVARDGRAVVGLLRLSVPEALSGCRLTRVFANLARLHPELELDVSFDDRLTDLVSEGYDAAIRMGTLRDSGLIARQIGRFHSVVAASPDYLAAHGTPLVPEDLMNHECLVYKGRLTPEWHFRSGGRQVAIRPRGRLRSDSGGATIEWAIAGFGIVDAPSFLVADALARGGLVRLFPDYETTEYGIFVVRPPGAYLPRKVRVLIDALVENFGGQEA